ncbi:outer membrane protein W [Marinobacterium nitratireducens]|uniref:Outer membrane protein W n=1 Tax=Marinobacterium nitratireducens TaxID=518897 RepID=A0A918DNF2_9GAMM|nr:OmpW family outer membrane protein [Marinobacterium nitratireducens]GGO76829.1 outer membrane protein W [Marinobacterium nitratireducens]
MKKHLLSVLAVAGLAGVSGNALAYDAGDVIVRAGYASVQPDANPHGVLDALDADVDDGEALGITAAYMLNDSVALELLVATPFNHDITAGGNKIGDADQLPPTLSLQWLPNLDLGGLQPYVGVGINYTTFFSEDSSLGKLKLDDSWGLAWQAGIDYQFNQHWLLNAAVWNIDIETDVKLDGAKIGSVEIDPWVYMVGVGYRF